MMPNPLNLDKTKAVTPREHADLEVNKHFVYQQFSLVKFKLQPAVYVHVIRAVSNLRLLVID